MENLTFVHRKFLPLASRDLHVVITAIYCAETQKILQIAKKQTWKSYNITVNLTNNMEKKENRKCNENEKILNSIFNTFSIFGDFD